MGSPFPGMDPYIEVNHLWEDFHIHLIDEIHRALAAVVPERYVVRSGERSYVAVAQADEQPLEHSFVPDVAIATGRGSAKSSRRTRKTAGAITSASSPVVMQAMVKAEYREPYLEIRQVAPDRKLVTGIEVLSPSNKRPGSKGWRLYYRKRLAYLSGQANLVEIDLVRRGRRMPMVSAWPDSPYYLLVYRKQRSSRCTVWPAYVSEPLPPLPIPLAPPDADLSLDLQPLVAAVYARSRYDRDIDYRRPIRPPLGPADQAWLEERLR